MKCIPSLFIESGRTNSVIPSVVALLAIVVFFNLPVQLSADVFGPRKSRVASIQERAANVKRQLAEHQRQADLLQRELKARTSAGVPPKVSMQFNKLLKTSSSIFFYDDMESGTNGWTVPTYSDSAAWHQTTLDANSPTHSWWPGIESQGNYVTGARVHEELISPAINLTGATGNITLLFTENYFTECAFDYCMVDVTTDGGTTWTHLRGGYGESPSGDSYGWKVSTLDLSPYADQTINLRFVFDTGDSLYNAFPGWFVDNVAVFDQSEIVSGKVYYDQNRNGIFDDRERGLRHWLVTVNGPLTLTMQTTCGGTFSLPLPLGSYQISEDLQTPWTETSTPTTISVELDTSGQVVNGVNFGNYRLGCLVLGTVFNDLNKDSLFTPGEPPFMDPWIELSDSNGYWIDDAQADSTGQFEFLVFGAGRYYMTEYLPSHWISTVPPERYYGILVPPRDTVLSGYLFGSYEFIIPAHSAIRGSVFNDLNRNGMQDDREPGLQNRVVLFLESHGWGVASTLTDSAGIFSFENLVAGNYGIQLDGNCGWRQSVPAGNYSIQLDSGQVKDSLLFGSYQLFPGSISGTLFNDLDGNEVRDPGEQSISGYQVYLSGFYCTSNLRGIPNVRMTTVSDDTGHYRFDGLGTGTYYIRIGMSAHWRQTYPTSIQPQTVALGDEENRTGTDFGITYDSTFNLAFRSFLPETIAYVNDHLGNGHPGLALKVKTIGSKATFVLVTPIGGLNGLHVEFSYPLEPSRLTVSYFPPPAPGIRSKKWEFNLGGVDTLSKGDSVLITATSTVSNFWITKYWWEKGALSPAPGTVVGRKTTGTVKLLLPMPNVMNVLQNIYSDGLPTKYGLTVGLVPGWHSAYATSATNVWHSLYQSGHKHDGVPRCLGRYSSTPLSPIKKSVSTLKPSQHNNILFAEALTLKANIAASEFNITPFGFGSLIFHGDSANPFNGLSVNKISLKLDTAMSKFDDKKTINHKRVGGDTCFCSYDYFNTAYATIRMIDSAFSGPFDTISFAHGLLVKPVRTLSDVPFLTVDSSFSSLAVRITPARSGFVEEPLQYKLEQNYPNPFNPTTTLSFTLAQASFVTLKVYNILGQEVAALINREQMDEGPQEIEFDASNLASGVYFYRIKAEGIADPDNSIAGQTYVAVKKMVLVK